MVVGWDVKWEGGACWTTGRAPTTQFNPTQFNNFDCQPTSLWGAVRRPYPTGAWWTNLVLGKGDNNVAQLPYAIKATDAEGVQVCGRVGFLGGGSA